MAASLGGKLGVSMKDETELLRGLKLGEEQAYRALWDRYRRVVYRHVLANGARARSTHDAEEITQEVFVRAFQGVGRFEGRCSLKSWLFTLSRNAAVDYYRSASNRVCGPNPGEVAWVAERGPSYEVGLEDGRAVNPLEQIEARDQIEVLFAQLSKEQRAAMIYRMVDGLSTAETAEAMKKGESAVKMLLSRALAKLTPLLSGELPIPDAEDEVQEGG